MPDIREFFESIVKGSLKTATHRFKGLRLLSADPERNAQGWLSWKLEWTVASGDAEEYWEVTFSAHKEQGTALAEFIPKGWNAPGLNSSVSKRLGGSTLRDWEQLDAGDLLKAGLSRAAKYRYFQEPLRSQHMKAARVAARWEARSASLPATAFVQADGTAVFFGFEIVIPRMDAVKMFDRHAADAHGSVKAAVASLARAFGGKPKVPDSLLYAVENGDLVVSDPAPAATGVFGIDVHAAIAAAGGNEPFKKAIEAAFAKVGWAVKSVEGL